VLIRERERERKSEREMKRNDGTHTGAIQGDNTQDEDAPLELWGSEGTYNLEPVLSANVRDSDYFRKTGKLELVTEVVDEIYYRVEHVEPWMSGGARGPSTAFCLLVRLFTIRLSERDVRGMMDHVDSPYIRCIGFLYARYVLQPRTMWTLLRRYVNDEEEFTPGADGKKTLTMGRYVCDLLLNRRYFDTLLPRIPTLLEKEIVAAMENELGRSAMKAVGGGGGETNAYGAGNRSRPASVKESLSVSTRQRVPNRIGSREYDDRDRDAYRSRDRRQQDRGYERDRDRSPSGDRERYRERYGSGGASSSRDYRYDSRRDYRYESRDRYDNRDRYESRDNRDRY